MGVVAAPLLAGFSVAFAGGIVTHPGLFRWTNATLTLVVAAALSLVGALQFTFRARQWAATPSEIERWWRDADDPERMEALRREQREHFQNYVRWSNAARVSYNLGIFFFLCGLTVGLIPADRMNDGRITAVTTAALGAALEIAWLAHDVKRLRERQRR
jgi:hypothetical protein